MGGGDAKRNLVALTPEEHFLAHLLLLRMHPKHPGLAIAAAMMTRDNRNGKRANNKLYGWLRKTAADAQSKRLKGRPRSESTKSRIAASMKVSEAYKEHVATLVGVPRTAEVRAKVSASHRTSQVAAEAREKLNLKKIGVPRSAETRAKVGAAHRGRTLSEEHRSKIAAGLRGQAKAPEHVAKVAAALRGKPGTRLGAKVTEETRNRMRAAAVERERRKREASQSA